MIDRIFLAHPRSVDESYGEHFGVASRFGVAMIIGGFASLLHAFVPSVCETSGSDTVKRLHAFLMSRAPKTGDAPPEI